MENKQKFLGNRKARLLLLLAVALFIRVGVVSGKYENLTKDRDAYRGIAENLAEGKGYSTPGSESPTAYRPPLYPVLLSALLKLQFGTVGIGVVHILLGTATVAFTWLIGFRLGLGRFCDLSALFVAVDPLLLQYTTFVMTETFFTFLVAGLLWLLLPDRSSRSILSSGEEALSFLSWKRQLAIGVFFGLSALCRPTIWAFLVLWVLWWGWLVFRSRRQSRPRSESQGLFLRESKRFFPWGVLVSMLVIVSPWGVRNAVVLGQPILTTTHGGYTLLLGNNPVFYKEVVRQPWGTVWEEESLRDWQESLEKEIAGQIPAVEGEVARDRWMTHRAMGHIFELPVVFLQACLLRIGRLWSPVPLGEAAGSVPLFVYRGVVLFNVLFLGSMLVGICRLSCREWHFWMPLILLLLSFTLVHSVYWSNIRMRAPLVPAMSVLAARGWLMRPLSSNRLQ